MLALPLALALAPCFPSLPGLQGPPPAGPGVTAADAQLAAIIDPQAASPDSAVAAEQGQPDADLGAIIKSLLTGKDDPAPIQLLGAAAIPTLEDLVRTQSSMNVIQAKVQRQPIYHLWRIDGPGCIRFLQELLVSDPERFAFLTRAGHTPLRIDNYEIMYVLGEARPAALQLLDAALASPVFDAREKLDIACNAYEEEGLATDTSRALIKGEMSEELSARLGRKALWNFVLQGGERDPLELSEEVAIAVAEKVRTHELWTTLTESPHVKARQYVWELMAERGIPGDMLRKAALAPGKSIDPAHVPTVVRAFAHNEKTLRGSSLAELISFARLFIASPSDRGNIQRDFADAIRNAVSSASRPEDSDLCRELIRVVYGAPLLGIHRRLEGSTATNLLSATQDPDIALAIFDALIHRPYSDKGDAVAGFWRNVPKPDGPRRASYILDGLLLADPAQPLAGLAPDRPGLLSALPEERHAEALAWLAAAGPELERAAVLDTAQWRDGHATFRASAFDETRSWRERSLAIIGLFSTYELSDQDVESAAQLLGERLGDPADRALFMRLLGLRGTPLEINSRWNEVVARLYASKSLENGAKEQLPLSSNPTSPAVLQSLLDAAENLTGKNQPFLRFANVANAVGPAAARGDVIIPSKLMSNWLSHLNGVSTVVTHALSGSAALSLNHSRQHLLDRLRTSEESSNSLSWLCAEVLRFPGDDTVPKLIDATASLNSLTLNAAVLQRIEQLLKLRDLKGAWSGGAKAPTRASALERLLELLRTGGPDARLEAIRALGTLGAVEALPELIQVVDSGTEAEKALAKATLKGLSERALKESLKGE